MLVRTEPLLIQSFTNPEYVRLTLAKLYAIGYKTAEQYVSYFQKLIDLVPNKSLDNSVKFFLQNLPEDVRKEVHSNEQNLASLKNMYNSLMRVTMFRHYLPNLTTHAATSTVQSKRCKYCRLRGHVKLECRRLIEKTKNTATYSTKEKNNAEATVADGKKSQ
jgi:hypothetical protein